MNRLDMEHNKNRKHGRTMKELPAQERPYEKYEAFGAASLTDAELLAVIIRTGTRGSNTVDMMHQVLQLSDHRSGLLGLHQSTEDELMKIRGIGRVKAIQLKCIGELTRRMAKLHAGEKLSFTSPATIADYYMEDMRHADREIMMIAFLDGKNRLLSDKVISMGTVNASVVSPREIFMDALARHAVHLILLHNHPSGDPTPSRQDILLTRRIREAGVLIGIQLLDHIIIGDNKYISLQEQGIVS